MRTLSPSASVSTSIFSTTRRLVTTRALGENPTNPFEEDILAAERKLADEMFKFLRWWQREITASIHRNDPSYQLQQIQARGKDISMVMQDNFVWNTAHEQFNSRFSDLSQTMMRDGVMQAQQLVGNVNFQLTDATTAALSRQYMGEWWSTLAGSTRTQMRDAFTRSMTEGWTQTRLRQELTPLFGRARAEVIATTETTRLYALGNLTGYSAAGIEQVEWRTARDDHVCPICVPLHGERFTVSMVCGPNVTQFKDLLLRLKEGCGFEMDKVDISALRGQERIDAFLGKWRTIKPREPDHLNKEDLRLKDVLQAKGWLRPESVPKAKLLEMQRNGEVHPDLLFRGVTQKAQAQQFIDAGQGKATMWVGRGGAGNGTYAARGYGASEAVSYAQSEAGGVLRMGVRPDFRWANYAELSEQYNDFMVEAIELAYKTEGPLRDELFDIAKLDKSTFAAMLGYDGIDAGANYWVILNHGKVVVQNTVLQPFKDGRRILDNAELWGGVG